MIFHENRLPADDSHEISCLICFFFEKAAKFEIVICIGGALRVRFLHMEMWHVPLVFIGRGKLIP